MRNLKLSLCYDGSSFHGWQIQKNGISVQQILQEALSKICKEPIRVIGCSRTDAGVHAAGYVCNFRTNCAIPAEKVPYAVNTVLPDDVAAYACEVVPEDFHARFSAKSKIYRYTVYQAPHRDPLRAKRAWHFPLQLEFEKMSRAAAYFKGEKDFSAFMAAGGQQMTSVRTMYELRVEKDGPFFFILSHANGYLYNMVRIIAGTLVYVGCGKILPDDIPDIIASRDRRRAGITAPPQGLQLEKVFY